MYPWEHFAVGYVAYSLIARAVGRDPPTGSVFAAVLFGSQFPDLVDKSGSWLFGVFPSGVSVAHSVFVAVPLVIGVVALAGLVGRRDEATAFGIAYLLHPPADVAFSTVVNGGSPEFAAMLWPVAAAQTAPPGGFAQNVWYYLSQYPERIVAVGPRYLAVELTLICGAVWLWIRDGTPGLPWSIERLRAVS